MQITLFSAIMCIDKRRQERRAFDVAVCFNSTGQERAGYCCGGLGSPNSDGYDITVSITQSLRCKPEKGIQEAR